MDYEKLKTGSKLEEIKRFADEKQMVINSGKTKIMLFNKSHKYDFMPEITISQGENLEVIEEFKILGLVISTDLKWNKHIEYMCKRGFMKLRTLRRL